MIIKRNKLLTLAAAFVCTSAGLFFGTGSVSSENAASSQIQDDCSGKGKVIILSETSTSQIHAVYDFQAGKLTTLEVYKDGRYIIKKRTETLR